MIKYKYQIFSDEPLLDEEGLVEQGKMNQKIGFKKHLYAQSFSSKKWYKGYRFRKTAFKEADFRDIENHDIETELLLAKSDTAEMTLATLLSGREDIYASSSYDYSMPDYEKNYLSMRRNIEKSIIKKTTSRKINKIKSTVKDHRKRNKQINKLIKESDKRLKEVEIMTED
tara:strand:+ start:75 stop:587 length:513 start_codon:yes stop_codon:yes gene_type:complete